MPTPSTQIQQRPSPWNPDTLYFYLRNGWEQAHGIARGPMVPVVTNLGVSPENDVQAFGKIC